MSIYFDVFNPQYFSHWVIALIQLLHRDKYWWVCHVTVRITPTDELHVHCCSLGLQPSKPHDRELLWYDLCSPSQVRTVMLYWLPQRYFINCSYAVSMLTRTPLIYTRPSLLYEAAILYESIATN